MNNTNNEDQYDTNNPGYFLAGLLFGTLLGGLIGAVTALLLAPQSGKKARRQLRRKGMKARKQTARAVDDGINQVRDKARQVTTDIQEGAVDLQHRGQDAVGQQIDNMTAAVDAKVNSR